MRYIAFVFALGLTLSWTGCLPEDDDGQGPLLALPTLKVSDLSTEEGSEGTTTVMLRVSVEGLNVSNIVVDYRTVNGSAVAGQDFLEVAAGKLLFTPADQFKDIAITVLADEFLEEDEDFELVFSNPRNAVLEKERARIVLQNDDAATDPYGVPTDGYVSADSYPGMQLVWEDDFSGEQLDESSWTFEMGTGNNGWGNNELQYYRRENTLLYNGFLIIEGRKENFGGREYTSSRIITRAKREFRYGRIDIRAALPIGQGIWPALWMLGRNLPQVGWPASGEIDIMEYLGHQPKRVYGTAHYGASTAQHQSRGGSTALSGDTDFNDAFHVFSLIWTENRLEWLVDDQSFFVLTADQVGSAPWPFNQPFFFIFNMAIGGNWPGSPDATTIFPQRLIVDYVRVFQ